MPPRVTNFTAFAERRRVREKLLYQGRRIDGTFKKMKSSKYKSRLAWADGIRFDSKAEAARYLQLAELQKMGLIDQLERQVAYPCDVNGRLVCTWFADFRYRIRPRQFGQRVIVEEVKGIVTDIYRVKHKLVLALYPGLEIIELDVKKHDVNNYRYLTADQFHSVKDETYERRAVNRQPVVDRTDP